MRVAPVTPEGCGFDPMRAAMEEKGHAYASVMSPLPRGAPAQLTRRCPAPVSIPDRLGFSGTDGGDASSHAAKDMSGEPGPRLISGPPPERREKTAVRRMTRGPSRRLCRVVPARGGATDWQSRYHRSATCSLQAIRRRRLPFTSYATADHRFWIDTRLRLPAIPTLAADL